MQWLTNISSVFKILYDAHRELNLSVHDHLKLRDRLGDTPLFLDERDRAACIAQNQIWELRVILTDGSAVDTAGSSLDKCISTVRGVVNNRGLAVAVAA